MDRELARPMGNMFNKKIIISRKECAEGLTELSTNTPDIPNSALSTTTVYVVIVEVPAKPKPVSSHIPHAPSPLVTTVATDVFVAGTA
jgi:hypothetical protein